jgi:hypothetical protein
MRRAWRGLPENAVARKVSTNDVASSRVCSRAPMLITLASLCCLASWAISARQTRAARTPSILLAAICSPLPEPPMTTPSEPSSATTLAPGVQAEGRVVVLRVVDVRSHVHDVVALLGQVVYEGAIFSS